MVQCGLSAQLIALDATGADRWRHSATVTLAKDADPTRWGFVPFLQASSGAVALRLYSSSGGFGANGDVVLGATDGSVLRKCDDVGCSLVGEAHGSLVLLRALGGVRLIGSDRRMVDATKAYGGSGSGREWSSAGNVYYGLCPADSGPTTMISFDVTTGVSGSIVLPAGLARAAIPMPGGVLVVMSTPDGLRYVTLR